MAKKIHYECRRWSGKIYTQSLLLITSLGGEREEV
jgi:hypothetical protein